MSGLFCGGVGGVQEASLKKWYLGRDLDARSQLCRLRGRAYPAERTANAKVLG